MPLTTIKERYQISGEPVGKGGMGIVYKAYDPQTRRYVALKTMRGPLDSGALELFSKEWTVLGRLNHPNIVNIFDTGEFEEDGQRKPFFVMPFLPGRTLDYLIKNASQRLTPERVIEIVTQTCRGLQAAHESGLVHRDLKPSNIFVMEDDTVQIIDFGVVHLAGTQSFTIKGTLQYMPPEQIDMKPTSPASDIFSLGVVCYESLTGRKPFARKTEEETAEAVRRHIPPPVYEFNPLVSQLVGRVIHKAMAKAPHQRFSSAREFAETLQKALANQPDERFKKIQPRIARARKAQAEGDLQFASEVLSELEAEGHIDPDMTMLRLQINQAVRQKTIWQLLESARTRREEEEYLLALQKLQEVLDIDPDNADALSLRADIERERGSRQVEDWFRLVEQHINQNSFAQARQALQEILNVDPNNARACEMLVETGRREQEINRLRTEKEQLYQAAVGCYENGELSSAESKLERVLEFIRATPDSATADRDAEYQSLYNRVRGDRDAARSAYADGHRSLVDKNYDKVIEICVEYLGRYPADPLFQALQLEAEESRRQQQSAYLAEVSRRANAEPDLDRRLNIYKEAAERYPDEPYLQQSLRTTRSLRDLQNTQIGKARQYEDRSQFADALSQWEMLRKFYPQYPGIEFEIERLTRRREEQVRDEAKARFVEQIDQRRAVGDYARARDLVRKALLEFPGDGELSGLDRLTQQDLEKATEAEMLLKEGERLCFERSYAEGLNTLRRASALSPGNPVIRAALLNALVEQARSVLGKDWRAAEPLIQQALSIDGGHPVAKSLKDLVTEYKRREIVDETVSRARELQAEGDVTGALALVEETLRTFPNELRLTQLRLTLKKSLPESGQPASPPDTDPGAREIPEARRAAAAGAAPAAGANSEVSLLDRSFDRTEIYPPAPEPPKVPEPPPAEPPRSARPASWRGFARDFKFVIEWIASLRPRFSRAQWVAVTVCPAVVIAVIASETIHRRPKPAAVPPPAGYAFTIDVEPAVPGAQYFLDGKAVSGEFPPRLSGGFHTAEARAEGYVTATQRFTVSGNPEASRMVTLNLVPEPLRIRVASDLKSGQVSLDDAAPADLQEGGFVNDRLALSAPHTLALTASGKPYLSAAFSAEPAKMAVLTSPLKAADVSVVVVSNLSTRTIVYAGNSAMKARVGSEPAQPIPPSGLDLSGMKAGTEVTLTDGASERPVPIDAGNGPSLTFLVTSDPDSATLQVEVNVTDAEVSIEGGHKPRHLRGTSTIYQLASGKYVIDVTKDGFNPEQRPVELKKGTPQNLHVELTPVAAKPAPPQQQPVVSSLSITGGSPDAEVLIDGQHAGNLGSDGSFSRDKIAPGSHTIALRKAGFEDGAITNATFAAGQPVHISQADATLVPLGAIDFQITPQNASIVYVRDGETQQHKAENGSTVPLKQGRYSLSVSAPGFRQRSDAVTITAGKTLPVGWRLAADALPCTFDKAVWTKGADGWSDYRGSSFAFRCADADGVLAIEVKRPHGLIPIRHHIEFRVDYQGANDYIEYLLDENHIDRKVFIGGVAQAPKRNIAKMGSADVWPLRIAVQADKISIESGSTVLDSFPRTKPSAPRGQISFKGDIQIKQLN